MGENPSGKRINEQKKPGVRIEVMFGKLTKLYKQLLLRCNFRLIREMLVRTGLALGSAAEDAPLHNGNDHSFS